MEKTHYLLCVMISTLTILCIFTGVIIGKNTKPKIGFTVFYTLLIAIAIIILLVIYWPFYNIHSNLNHQNIAL